MLDYAEIQGYGFVHEGQVGEFSATLGWLGVALVGRRAIGFLSLLGKSKAPRCRKKTRQGRGSLGFWKWKGAAFRAAPLLFSTWLHKI